MKAILFYGPKDLRYQEVKKPEIKPGEVLVKIKAALTGGTDTKTYLNGHPRIIKSIPSAFGYEFAGVVDLSNNPDFKVGDRVVAANTSPCFNCFFCEKKEFELCQNLEFLNGSFAEYIALPAAIAKNNLYKFSESLDFQQAAATQTLAVTLHGLAKSAIKEKDTVVIYGIGAIGQCFIKACRLLYPQSSIIAIGSSTQKLKLAKKNGANHILNYKESDIETEVKKITNYGADVVIEAVGKIDAWQTALKLVRPGGLINFFGGCPKGTKLELDSFQVHYEELRIVGSFHHTPTYIKEALALLESKKINIDDLLTHTMPLTDLEKALQLMLSGEALKVVVKP